MEKLIIPAIRLTDAQKAETRRVFDIDLRLVQFGSTGHHLTSEILQRLPDDVDPVEIMAEAVRLIHAGPIVNRLFYLTQPEGSSDSRPGGLLVPARSIVTSPAKTISTLAEDYRYATVVANMRLGLQAAGIDFAMPN